MILVLPVALGLVLALAFGGDPRLLTTLELRRPELFYVAVALQLVAFPLAFMPWHVSDGVSRGLWLASYAVLCSAALLNLKIAGVPIVAAGMLSNILAVVMNGGHMPALPSALRALGKTYIVHFNSAAKASPSLPWLVDRWAVPAWLPVGNVYSVGDVVIAVGAVVVIAAGSQLPLSALLPRRLVRDAG